MAINVASLWFGGILADDMGLGKTLQTIAYLSAHLEDGQRVLILSPSSLIYNWRMSLKICSSVRCSSFLWT